MVNAKYLLLLSLMICTLAVSASELLDNRIVVLRTSAGQYSSCSDTIHFQGEKCMLFRYSHEDEICDVKLYITPDRYEKISLVESSDFELLDSMINYNNQYFSFKVRFRNLSESNFLRFRFLLQNNGSAVYADLPLMPVPDFYAYVRSVEENLSLFDEKIIPIETNVVGNVVPDKAWVEAGDLNYKISVSNHQAFLHVKAFSTGNKILKFKIHTFRPFFSNGTLIDRDLSCSLNLKVKKDKYPFLNFEKKAFDMPERNNPAELEVAVERDKGLEPGRMYLIVAGESVDAMLVAQLLPLKAMGDKIMCHLRILGSHHQSDGVLCVKDGSATRFVTNFDVMPETIIEKVKVMTNGVDWKENMNVFPGQIFRVRVQGKNMEQARLRFDELINLTRDSVMVCSDYQEFKFKMPLTILKKKIEIYDRSRNTGLAIAVGEIRKPRNFDYIKVNYGDRSLLLKNMKTVEYYDKAIGDVSFSFLPDVIDSLGSVYGKQYIDIQIKVLGKKDEVIEDILLSDLGVCPGNKSPRYQFYDKSDCSGQEISINSKLENSVYNLKDWYKIKLIVKNSKGKYTDELLRQKEITIILRKKYEFDVDVAFPTGLLIDKFNKPGLSNFSGVSMSVLGQFSFYRKNRVNEFLPFKVGAGFIAMNAFQYGEHSDRDLGAVVLSTFNPLNTGRKLSFSLYIGAGYLVSAQTFFWLIGPGINVSF